MRKHYYVTGNIKLTSEATAAQIRDLLQNAGCSEEVNEPFPDQAWSIAESEGELLLAYHFSADDKAWTRAQKALTHLGLTAAAWEEEVQTYCSFEGQYDFAGTYLRGSPEQIRSYRLKQIDEEIVNLKAERERLLTEPSAA